MSGLDVPNIALRHSNLGIVSSTGNSRQEDADQQGDDGNDHLDGGDGHDRLGTMLLERGSITQEQFARAVLISFEPTADPARFWRER